MLQRPVKTLVSAPGKLMVSGEYAVLEGATAVVAAVDRRAYARVGGDESAPVPAEALAAFRIAERRFGAATERRPSVDVTSLRAEGSKLGLGSSAAAAAACAGLVYAEQGQDLTAPGVRDQIFDAALRGHREISPQGSGADVAAAVHGGFVRFRRHGDATEIQPIRWPAQLRARVVWTHQEARTSSFLDQVNALSQREPERHRSLFASLAQQAERFAAALAASDIATVIASAAAYGRAMGELGDAAKVPILTDTLRAVGDMARTAGGAAKPSGAGGGDVALALFPDDHAEQRFCALCQERNFTVLLIGLGAPGVSIEKALSGSSEET